MTSHDAVVYVYIARQTLGLGGRIHLVGRRGGEPFGPSRACTHAAVEHITSLTETCNTRS